MGTPATSPCDTCDARCCSAYTVHLTGEDAFRLTEATGAPLHAFVAHARQAVPSATGFLLERGGPTHDLVLAHARAVDARPPCPFLRAGADRLPPCGVYAFRPRACRRFPAARLDGRYGVRDDIVCPPGAWARHDMARLSWRVALLREEREGRAYAAVVAAWNARVERAGARGARTLVDYLDHVADAYRWLVRRRASLAPAERGGAALLEELRDTLRSCSTGPST